MDNITVFGIVNFIHYPPFLMYVEGILENIFENPYMNHQIINQLFWYVTISIHHIQHD